MTPGAKVAFEIYRDLGPARSLDKLTELSTSCRRVLADWSSEYEWVRLTAEHDHKHIRQALASRPLIREHAEQKMIDNMDGAADVLAEIAFDRSVLPVLDRQGEHMRGPATKDGKPGELLYKPVVKPSTRANCAEKILGLGGLVPVKRIEVQDRTGEELDDAAAYMEGMHPDDQAELREMIKRRNRILDGEE